MTKYYTAATHMYTVHAQQVILFNLMKWVDKILNMFPMYLGFPCHVILLFKQGCTSINHAHVVLFLYLLVLRSTLYLKG